MLKTKIYKNSPVFIQNSLLTARGFVYKILRESGAFRKILSELEQTQHYTDSEIQEWQNERLVRLVRHSYENVPYYNRLFKKMKLLPIDIKNALLRVKRKSQLCQLVLNAKDKHYQQFNG